MPPKERTGRTREQGLEREAAAAALPALASARAPAGQLDALAVQRLTGLAGNGAVARVMRRGGSRPEGLGLPETALATERLYEAPASAPRETDAGEGLSALPELAPGAAWT